MPSTTEPDLGTAQLGSDELPDTAGRDSKRGSRLISGIVLTLATKAVGIVVPLLLVPMTLEYLGSSLYGLCRRRAGQRTDDQGGGRLFQARPRGRAPVHRIRVFHGRSGRSGTAGDPLDVCRLDSLGGGIQRR